MIKFKVGDMVKDIRREAYKDDPIKIIKVNGNRYQLEYLNVYNVQGTNMLFWVDVEDIELDLEYYREQKINNILNG